MEPHVPGRKRLRSKDVDDAYSPGMFYKIVLITDALKHFSSTFLRIILCYIKFYL